MDTRLFKNWKYGSAKEALPKDIVSIFKSDKYQMILINSKYEMATDELNAQVETINQIIKNTMKMQYLQVKDL